jgi:hypothetical protein
MSSGCWKGRSGLMLQAATLRPYWSRFFTCTHTAPHNVCMWWERKSCQGTVLFKGVLVGQVCNSWVCLSGQVCMTSMFDVTAR